MTGRINYRWEVKILPPGGWIKHIELTVVAESVDSAIDRVEEQFGSLAQSIVEITGLPHV